MIHIYYLVLVSAIAGGDYKAQQIDSYIIPSQCVVAVDARSMYLKDEPVSYTHLTLPTIYSV